MGGAPTFLLLDMSSQPLTSSLSPLCTPVAGGKMPVPLPARCVPSLPDTPRLGCGPGLGPRSLMVTHQLMAAGPGCGAVSVRHWRPLEGTLGPLCF